MTGALGDSGTDPTGGSPYAATSPGDGREVSTEGAVMMQRLEARLFDADVEPVKLGRFAVLRTIGAGGMGVVHLGYDEVLDRRVAIKLIRSERSASPEARQRLLREARAMARLSHANVVQIFEAGEHEGAVYLAMEYVEGQTLGRWLTAKSARCSSGLPCCELRAAASKPRTRPGSFIATSNRTTCW